MSSPGDVILTYSYSKLVERALLDAAEAGKKIKVIVADERVESLGRSLSSRLVGAGVHTTYILLTAVSQVIQYTVVPGGRSIACHLTRCCPV